MHVHLQDCKCFAAAAFMLFVVLFSFLRFVVNKDDYFALDSARPDDLDLRNACLLCNLFMILHVGYVLSTPNVV